MPVLLLIAGAALLAGLAVGVWRLARPGRRLRLGAVTLDSTPGVTAEEAARVGEYLVRQRYATDVRLTRDGATYRLQLLGAADRAGEKQDVACEVLAAGLSDDVLAGAAVEVHVCDGAGRPVSAVRHRGRFGRRITMNAAYLFYLDGVTDDEAMRVAAFLAGAGLFNDSPKVAQLDRADGGYEFRLAVEADPLTAEMRDGERRMAADLTRVLRGGPVAVRYCPGLLGALRPRAAGDGAYDCHVPGGPYRAQVFGVPDGAGTGPREEYKDG